MQYLLSLDQGTTSSRAILFDLSGRIVDAVQYEFPQYYPQEGWVEHNADEILESMLKAVSDVMSTANVCAGEVLCIGVTNQRETTVVWDRKTGRPVHPAIVWQCRRTAPMCEQLVEEGLTDYVQEKTGLLIDAYFSATKLRYILDQIPDGQRRAESGDLLFGTVDTWLIWNLTGAHVTDYSNAARTMLFDIHTLQYDDTLLKRLRIPLCMLPLPKPSACTYGRVQNRLCHIELLDGVPVSGAAGDQQAALFGQACFSAGQAKCTYGTGSFLMMHTGDTPVVSENRLLTTVAWGIGNQVEYALEGSIFNAGSSIKWLRDELGLISSSREVDVLAETVPDSNGVYFVSAFTGLGAPHWDMYARGTMVGLTRAVNRAHICRAVLEGIVYQVCDLVRTMEQDSGRRLSALKVDGGASVSNLMMQFQADMLDATVNRPQCVESTALGAAFLAGIGSGVFRGKDDVAAVWKSERMFEPHMDEETRAKRYLGWQRAVERALEWVQP